MMIWQAPQNGGIVENNTIVNNISSADGGGITMSVTDASTVPVVRNNIIWGNRQASGRQVAFPEYVNFNTIEDYASGTNVSSFPARRRRLAPSLRCITLYRCRRSERYVQ